MKDPFQPVQLNTHRMLFYLFFLHFFSTNVQNNSQLDESMAVVTGGWTRYSRPHDQMSSPLPNSWLSRGVKKTKTRHGLLVTHLSVCTEVFFQTVYLFWEDLFSTAHSNCQHIPRLWATGWWRVSRPLPVFRFWQHASWQDASKVIAIVGGWIMAPTASDNLKTVPPQPPPPSPVTVVRKAACAHMPLQLCCWCRPRHRSHVCVCRVSR